jgi:3-oxoacyl-[acyl-carrier-protein] synthase II
MENAYVVGYGLIDALGNNPSECFTRMLDDNDYSSELPHMVEENHKIHRGYVVDEQNLILPEGWDTKGTTKLQRMAMHATKQALDMAGLPPSSNVAVLFSTCSNDTETLEESFPRLISNKRINPRVVVNRIPDMACAHISSYWQFMGVSTSLFASCATGILTIDYCMRLLDEYDYVICGAGDAGTFKVALKYFNAIGALGNHSKPFDDEREGFVMGDGAGVLILASEKSLQKYGATAYATLYPAGLASDAFDQTSPAQDGRGARLALEKATMGKPVFNAVSAHATSTPVGDVIEYDTITSYFGNVPIYAPKSKIGHTLAGAGIIETIYAIESMRKGIIPHVHNSNKLTMDDEHLQCVVRENKYFTEQSVLRTLNNSFGFGGKCASQIIEVRNEIW